MSLPKRRGNSRDFSSSESNEPSTSSLLSDYLIESSDESCPDSIYEDYLTARNYWNRRKAALAQKEILDRAYKFIYDEAFSNESTNESDFQVECNKRREFRNRRESAMPAGDGNDFLEFRRPDANYRSEKNRFSKPLKDRRNSKFPGLELGPRIFSQKLEERKFEESDSLFTSSAENFETEFRKIPLAKRLKNNIVSDADTSIRRKRKLPKIGRTVDFRCQKPEEDSKMRRIFPIADVLRRTSNRKNCIYDNKDPESSASDESFVIDVESVLQENSRSRLTVETVLLENTKNATDPRPVHRYRNTIDTHSNEARLLCDIKKRIDQDFEYDFKEIESESSILESESLEYFDCDKLTIASSKSSGQYIDFVESIDSGVSTDFSRNESDLSRSFNYPGAIGESDIFDPISVNSDADDGEILEAKVDEAVQRFTEELIMCERRAVEKGLTDGVEMGAERKKRKRKSLRKVRNSSSSSQRSDKTSSSPRFFPTSQSSGGSEEEYLENISTPSLCSISDSEMENL